MVACSVLLHDGVVTIVAECQQLDAGVRRRGVLILAGFAIMRAMAAVPGWLT
jgi:hypothetical protein